MPFPTAFSIRKVKVSRRQGSSWGDQSGNQTVLNDQPRVRKLVPLLGALAVVGCGHSAPRLEVSLLPALVLQPADVPKLERFDEGRITHFDAPQGLRSDTARLGRLDGWKADYKRQGGPTTAGPLIVHSQADLFRDGHGAQADLDLYRRQFAAGEADSPGSVELVRPTGLGDEAAGMTLAQGGSPGLRIFTIAWRQGTTTASVTVNGFSGRVSLSDALRLARRQDERIVSASG